MVRLPFAEDARNLDERLQPAQGEDWPVASAEQIDAAKGLIGKLTRKNFWPDNFSNPGTLILTDLNIISFSSFYWPNLRNTTPLEGLAFSFHFMIEFDS